MLGGEEITIIVIIALIPLVLYIMLLYKIWKMTDDVKNIRRMIERKIRQEDLKD